MLVLSLLPFVRGIEAFELSEHLVLMVIMVLSFIGELICSLVGQMILKAELVSAIDM
jgi:hypothetical protein